MLKEKQLYEQYKLMLDKELNSFLEEEFKSSEASSDSIKILMKHMKNFCLNGGKRLRGILFLLGYKAFKNDVGKEILRLAISVELLHSSLLIHDDVMDDSNLRRGNKSFHKIYEESVNPIYKNAKKYGENIAITAGDILLALSYNCIANHLKKVAHIYTKVIINTAYGQALDLESSFKNLSEQDVLNIHLLKSAKYTIEGPLHVGAVIADASEKDLKKLSDYAIPLGIAFQLKDDILGLFGDEKTIGKPITSDLSEGKKTLLMIKALEKASKEDRKFLLSTLGNRNITLKDVEKVRKIVKNTGSLEHSKNLMSKLIEESKSSLNNFKINEEPKKALLYLADYVAKRDL